MTPKQFQKEIKRTDHDTHGYHQRFIPRLTEPLTARLLHYSIGIAEESGEILSNIKKYVRDGKPIDRTEVLTEIGDLLWYCGNLLTALDSSFEEVMELNIKKLSVRYPDGFTEAGGLNRDTAMEREVLEREKEND